MGRDIQSPVSHQGHFKAKSKSSGSQTNDILPLMSYAIFCSKGIGRNEVEWAGKAEMTSTEFLALGGACMAII